MFHKSQAINYIWLLIVIIVAIIFYWNESLIEICRISRGNWHVLRSECRSLVRESCTLWQSTCMLIVEQSWCNLKDDIYLGLQDCDLLSQREFSLSHQWSWSQNTVAIRASQILQFGSIGETGYPLADSHRGTLLSPLLPCVDLNRVLACSKKVGFMIAQELGLNWLPNFVQRSMWLRPSSFPKSILIEPLPLPL
jgi:hypothetical protein